VEEEEEEEVEVEEGVEVAIKLTQNIIWWKISR